MIALRIRELRRARMLTRSELARRARISRGHLHHIEHEQFCPSVKTLIRIADGLDIELRRLLALTSLEIVLEDSFVQQVRPFLRHLNAQQRETLLRMLAAAPKQREVV